MKYEILECTKCNKPAYRIKQIDYKKGRKALKVGFFECCSCKSIYCISDPLLDDISFLESVINNKVNVVSQIPGIVEQIPKEYEGFYIRVEEKKEEKESWNKKIYILYDEQEYCNNTKCKNSRLIEYNSGYYMDGKGKHYLEGYKCEDCGRIYYPYEGFFECREAYKSNKIKNLKVQLRDF